MSREQLEWWILFGVCVANKPAKITEAKLKEFLDFRFARKSPFNQVRDMIALNQLSIQLRRVRFGQYARIEKAFRAAIDLDLENLTVESLEAVPGIGPKTARMIVLYSVPKADCVPLDTHVLKFLRSLGYDAPKSTPPKGKKYAALEQAFKLEAAAHCVSVRQLDTEVWKAYSGN